MPFADATFDVVFSKDALLHAPDKDSLFAENLPCAEAGRGVCRVELDDRA
ncbi:methyltransferase domain-containing protein [Mesorhizobium atlanticum]